MGQCSLSPSLWTASWKMILYVWLLTGNCGITTDRLLRDLRPHVDHCTRPCMKLGFVADKAICQLIPVRVQNASDWLTMSCSLELTVWTAVGIHRRHPDWFHIIGLELLYRWPVRRRMCLYSTEWDQFNDSARGWSGWEVGTPFPGPAILLPAAFPGPKESLS